jgi:enterochelin esterase-like enzyme
MRGRMDKDPFAVRTMTVAGEEVPFSDPYVTDAQRAAAGRETVAQRARALLAANRERAARRYADGGLPDGEDAQRVWRARDPADLRARLGPERFTAWAEDDVLHVLWQAGPDDGDRLTVTLAGGLSGLLWPVDGGDGLFEASLRVRRLDEAVLTLFVVAIGEDDLPFGRPVTDQLTWRGPGAPGDAAADSREVRPLAGQIREHTIESAALRAARPVTVYIPPISPAPAPLPVCVLADGQATRGFAEVLEAAIMSGAAPPVLLLGIHSAGGPQERTDRRSQEYLPRHTPRRFAAHLSFVTGEVMPWAAAEFDVGAGPCITAGFSNGAAWAVGAAVRRPDLFGGAAGLSLGMAPARIPAAARDVRQFLAAGTLEPHFRRATRAYAQRLRRAGVPSVHREWVGGHDNFWWRHTLPDALAWLLSADACPDECPMQLPIAR